MTTKDPSKPEPGKPDPAKPEAAKPAEATADANGTPAGDDRDAWGGKKKKKKKRKYSRGLKDVQRAERGLAKAGRRAARAVASGIGMYYDRDRKSSRKKRDGAIRDALKNWARGVGKAARRGSNVPYDVAKAFDTKTFRRNLRAAIRFVAPPFLR